ncbi:hypothetical protein BAE44_0016139 [Dichanthelium oligosanthes]|uniref:DUF4220 domain-containing protein n=1 Tax=Dichanthelium oligosanthes TaxID=888268 RepID=A0A1E5VCF6_9POAL|nr:hypothetical protein BAE44_0016139 [Dichanthelium oligosanthes]
MRILIAASLLMQWFLLLAAPMRKYTIPRWLRYLIWLDYIGCDALAIYALATLFSRQTNASSHCNEGVKASSLEVLWAPVLLIHLGGREEITAYNIEDNETWTRHTATLVSQVTVALYAFYKTWPDNSDRRLLWSAVLLFVIGVLSFCEKPWALRRASINRLVSVYSSLAAGERRKPVSWWEYLFTELEIGGKYIVGVKNPRGGRTILTEGDKVQMILSDMSLGAAAAAQKSRGRPEEDVLGTFDPGAEKDAVRRLRTAFGLIYTRANVVTTPAYLACHLLLVPGLHVAAIALFAASNKQAYKQFNAADVKMTYIILCFTAVLDVFEVPISELLYWVLSKTRLPALCETIPGDNLIDAVQKVKRPWYGPVIRCARSVGYRGDFFHRDDRHNLYGKVAGFVVTELFGTKLRGLDLATYRNTDRDSNWALKKLDVLFGKEDRKAVDIAKPIWSSLRVLPFDESILQWHIATDLCFRLSPPPKGLDDPLTYIYSECAVGISNYMAHLLNCRPDMLMTGSRQHLFSEALRNMDLMGREVWRSIYDAEDACTKHAVIGDAWRLAKELTELRDDKTRWELMYRVWVGLLCYSASMCRGYQHAKSLGEGGEFLSSVWLVMALKGAKTLADKLQMPDNGGGGGEGAKEYAAEGINLLEL